MGKVIEEAGNTYGDLTVVETAGQTKHHRALWLCLCSCGAQVIFTGQALRRGGRRRKNGSKKERRNCGDVKIHNDHAKLRDESGKRYGLLGVIRRVDHQQRGVPYRGVRYLCLCDCGKEVKVNINSLRTGNTTTCGCGHLSQGHAGFEQLFKKYQNSARYRKKEWTLTREEFRIVTGSPCFYCGDSPKRTNRSGARSGKIYTYNGIDRVDNDIGYTLKNSVPCCSDCNYMKHTKALDVFLDKVKKIAERHLNMKKIEDEDGQKEEKEES